MCVLLNKKFIYLLYSKASTHHYAVKPVIYTCNLFQLGIYLKLWLFTTFQHSNSKQYENFNQSTMIITNLKLFQSTNDILCAQSKNIIYGANKIFDVHNCTCLIFINNEMKPCIAF